MEILAADIGLASLTSLASRAFCMASFLLASSCCSSSYRNRAGGTKIIIHGENQKPIANKATGPGQSAVNDQDIILFINCGYQLGHCRLGSSRLGHREQSCRPGYLFSRAAETLCLHFFHYCRPTLVIKYSLNQLFWSVSMSRLCYI